MNNTDTKPEQKTSGIWPFNRLDKEEQKLISQYYVKLKIEYRQIKKILKSDTDNLQNTNKDTSLYEEVEFLLGEKSTKEKLSPEQTWRNAYYIEQLIALLLPKQKIDVELSRRIEEARRALPRDTYSYYLNKLTHKTDAEQAGHTDIDKQSLLISLISDLQWAKEKQQVEQSYGRTARLRATIIFVLAFFLFFLPNIIPAFSRLLLDTTTGESARIYFVFTAITAGSLGASFSLLISIRKRLEESNLDGVKILHRYSYIISRVVIGMGAGLIFYYFLQSGLIEGAILPTPFSGSAMPPSEPSASSSQVLEYRDLALVIIFSVLSGFSESLVPNLLSKTEKQIEGSEANQTAPVAVNTVNPG